MNQDVIDLMNQLTTKDEEIERLKKDHGELDMSHYELSGHLAVAEEDLSVVQFKLTNVTTERDVANQEIERLQDQMADYDNDMLRQFDERAADSTDLFTYITSLKAKAAQLTAERAKNDDLRGRIFSYCCLECGGQKHSGFVKSLFCSECGKPMARITLADTADKEKGE